MRYISVVLSLSVLFLVAGCGKRPAEREAEDPGVAVVTAHLDSGGPYYLYSDVTEVGNLYQTFAQRAFGGLLAGDLPPSVADYLAPMDDQTIVRVIDGLGLRDIHAIGASSVPQPNGLFRNNSFLYTPEGRSGLLRVVGGKPHSFSSIELASADTDLLMESDFDVGAFVDTIVGVLKIVGNDAGHAAIDGWLGQPAGDTGMTMQQALNTLPNRSVVYLRLGKSVAIPPALVQQLTEGAIDEIKIPTPISRSEHIVGRAQRRQPA